MYDNTSICTAYQMITVMRTSQNEALSPVYIVGLLGPLAPNLVATKNYCTYHIWDTEICRNVHITFYSLQYVHIYAAGRKGFGLGDKIFARENRQCQREKGVSICSDGRPLIQLPVAGSGDYRGCGGVSEVRLRNYLTFKCQSTSNGQTTKTLFMSPALSEEKPVSISFFTRPPIEIPTILPENQINRLLRRIVLCILRNIFLQKWKQWKWQFISEQSRGIKNSDRHFIISLTLKEPLDQWRCLGTQYLTRTADHTIQKSP